MAERGPSDSPMPVAFADLPLDFYPFTVELIHWQTGEVLWSRSVAAPVPGTRSALKIPGRAELGAPVSVRIRYGNGIVVNTPPPAETIPQ